MPGPASSGPPLLPLVLLHGFTGSAESWGPFLLDGLAAQGKRVVALDLPGHGCRRYTEETSLAEVIELVSDSVDGPFDLLGYSMGGRLALHCALALPGRIRRLVLESASPGLAGNGERARRRAADAALAERVLTDGVATFAEEWRAHGVLRPGPRRDARDQARVDGIRLDQRAEGLAGALRGLGSGSLPSLWGRLREVRQPTGLIVGALDEKFERIARRMGTAIQGSTVAVVPESGHTVHLDRPDAWLDFVGRCLSASP